MSGPTDRERQGTTPRAVGARGVRASWERARRDLTLLLRLLVAAAAAPWTVGPASAQSTGTHEVLVTAAVRPERVRVGDRFLVLIRVEAAEPAADVFLAETPDAELIGVTDRAATRAGARGPVRVLERELTLRALAPGRVSPARAFVVIGGDTTVADVPAVEAVGSAVAWGVPSRPRARGTDEPLRGEGRPPTVDGRDADAFRAPQGTRPPSSGVWGRGPWGVTTGGVPPFRGPGYGPPDDATWAGGGWTPGLPWSPWTGLPPVGAWSDAGAPYDPWGAYGGFGPGRSPWGVTGWGIAPVGRGWAETAAGDPWWPEVVPELERYTTAAERPDVPVLLEAGAAPERVWVGQQVTLMATVTFPPEAKARLGRSPRVLLPSPESVTAVDLPWAPASPVAARGRAQESSTHLRAYFPRDAGTLVLEPVRLVLGGDGPAGALDTDPLVVEVSPIPVRDAPQTWRGAVGRFRISARLEPEVVAWGEPAMLVVEVSGAGEVRGLPRPEPGPLWGAELRPWGERAVAEARDGVVGGVKTFTWIVAPADEGSLRIDPIVMAWFDPWVGAFAQEATEELELTVEPLLAERGAGTPVGRGATALRPFWSPPGSSAAATPSTAAGLVGLGALAAVLVGRRGAHRPGRARRGARASGGLGTGALGAGRRVDRGGAAGPARRSRRLIIGRLRPPRSPRWPGPRPRACAAR